MRKLELRNPGGSLDVLKTRSFTEPMRSSLGGEAFGLTGKGEEFLRTKRSKRALRSPMSAVSKYILQQIFLPIMMI